MKYSIIALGLLGLTGCSSTPLTTGSDRIVSHDASCSVSYPQLPRCECGCAGDICSTGNMGVVVCDSEQARGVIILPVRATTLAD